jgi:cell wall assembly regulator SMI1
MPQNQPSRIEVHRLFVEKFDQRYHLRNPITPAQIQRVENELGIVFPEPYTRFLEQYGAIGTTINMTLGYNGPYPPA